MSEVTKLTLSSLPSELDFEDYISAQLLLGGYTLDRRNRIAGQT